MSQPNPFSFKRWSLRLSAKKKEAKERAIHFEGAMLGADNLPVVRVVQYCSALHKCTKNEEARNKAAEFSFLFLSELTELTRLMRVTGVRGS